MTDENRKLSNDCNELEIALEICHQKMRGYEEELSLYCKYLERIEHDKKIIESNEKSQKGKIYYVQLLILLIKITY